MAYELRPGLHFCESAAQLVFLDLEHDRYFRLPAGLEDAFRTFIDPQTYSDLAIEALSRAAIIRPAAAPRPSKPAMICPPVQMWDLAEGAHLAAVLRAISLESFIAWRLRRGRIAKLIASLQDRKPSRPAGALVTSPPAGAIIAASSHAKLYRSPAGRCLSRSLALANQLAARGYVSSLVIGIRAEPFAAHCWVQAGDVVLNDTVEEASRYTPILVT